MKVLMGLILLQLSSVNAWPDNTSDWLAISQYKGSASITLGIDENDTTLQGFDIQWVLPYQALISAQWVEIKNRETLNDSNYTIELSTDPIENWSISIAYEYNDSEQIIETQSIMGSIQYFPGNWLLNLAYIDGEISHYVQAQSREFRTKTSTNIDYKGYRVAADYYSGPWSWQLAGRSHHYSVDFSQVTASRRLQRFLNQQTLTSIFNLIDWQIDSKFSYNWRKSTVGFGLTHYQLAIENSQGTNLHSTIDYQLSGNVSLAAMLAQSLDESLLYTELSARYQW